MVFVYAIILFAGLLLCLSLVLLLAEKWLVNYGVCEIDINASERVLEVDGGQTLLASLMGEEIYIPSACGGQGTCGFCKVTVLSGAGDPLPTETPYLDRKEVRRGVRLACQVKVRNNLAMRIPEDLLNVRMFHATMASGKMLSHDIREIRMALPEGDEITQKAGQYVQIQAPSPDGGVFRAYSISSPEYETDAVELVVRLIPGGIGSTFLHNLQVGDPIQFTGPYGEFELNEDPSVEFICVGGGAGMAPMRNLLMTILKRQPERTCWLFFGCRTTKDIFYLDQFQALAKEHPNFHIVYALSDPLAPDEKWDGETGFIHLAIDKLLPQGPTRQAFLCGPPPMIEAATDVLKEKGLADKDIFYDEF